MNFLIGSNDTESGLTDVVIIKFIYFIQEWRVRKNESFKIFNFFFLQKVQFMWDHHLFT